VKLDQERAAADEGRRRLLRRARLAQSLTVGWMVVEGTVALGAGIDAHSVALTAFGVDSGIELFSAGVVLHRLLGRTLREERGSLTERERRATGLVGLALYALIAYVVLAAAATLVLRIEPLKSPAGIGLALASLVIMAILWRWRLRLADLLGSPALAGDAACSLVCLYLAGATLAGLVLNQLLGIWWADPLAGLVLVWWIRGEAREAREAAAAPAID
jgi:divalent metal cation (Fe/Co/Zn/Cd) transporter